MIITQEVSSPVLSNIASAPTRFKIKASAKAFKILSGFYSEPILAIPRELGANAWDSHVKSGNTSKMFEVHAPNTLEPWFSVRDFGTGLSTEAIDTIYTTYFESTKTSDNDSDGCMGLGSKTPFNYTENFNVTSFYKGKKHVYNCFIDEQGAPNIMHVATQDSTEHNGLEIKFGVKISDIGMWVDKITRAYEPFRHRPTIVGSKISYQPREYIYQGKTWAMRKNDNGYYNRGCNAFMGNYCYPVNASAVRTALYSIPNVDGYKLEQALNYGNFDFFFEIGDLDVAPNKEQLQYGDDNATTKAIVAALQTAISELRDMVHKSIEKPSTRWEAMCIYNKYNGYNSPFGHIRNIIGDIEIRFNGDKIIQGDENVSAVHTKTGIMSATTHLTDTFRVFQIESVGGRMKSTSTYYSPLTTRPLLVLYTNKNSIKNSRVHHYLRTKYSNTLFPYCYVIIDESASNKNLLAHKGFFGWEDSQIIHIDTLPKPPVTPRGKSTVGTNEINYADISEFLNKNSSKNARVRWGKKAETIDSTKTYYYVDFYYSEPTWNGKEIGNFMHDIIKVFTEKKLNGDSTIVYGINVKNQNLLKVGTWVNVVDLVKTAVIADKNIHEDYLYKVSLREKFYDCNSLYTLLSRHQSIIKNIENSDTQKMFQSFLKVYNEICSDSVGVNDQFLTMFDIKAKKHNNLPINIELFSKTVKEKYLGILNLASSGYLSSVDQLSTVYKIINFIDQKS